MINAPVIVLSAAALSVIAKGGIPKSKRGGPEGGATDVLKFWASILGAAGGLILIDKVAPDVAMMLGTIWLVGGVLVNGPAVTKWLTGFGQGVRTP